MAVHKAAGLIRRRDSNIAAVSSAVGYVSESAFTKAFRRQIGMTPSDYRRRATPTIHVYDAAVGAAAQ